MELTPEAEERVVTRPPPDERVVLEFVQVENHQHCVEPQNSDWKKLEVNQKKLLVSLSHLQQAWEAQKAWCFWQAYKQPLDTYQALACVREVLHTCTLGKSTAHRMKHPVAHGNSGAGEGVSLLAHARESWNSYERRLIDNDSMNSNRNRLSNIRRTITQVKFHRQALMNKHQHKKAERNSIQFQYAMRSTHQSED